MSDSRIIDSIATSLNLGNGQIRTVMNLIDEGATIPFLARYRREVTGNLDEEVLRKVRDALQNGRTMEERRETILKTIHEQGKLSAELEILINSATDLRTLEDIYLPYKPKRKTKASIAKEKDLEPLAKLIWGQKTHHGDPILIASGYINIEKDVKSADDALDGACDICAEWVSENIDVRNSLRKQFREYGAIKSKKSKSVTERTVFEAYYEFNCRVKYIKPHQTLAINRGERENILAVDLEVWAEKVLDILDSIIVKNERSIFTDYLVNAYEDSYKRLIFPSLEREVRNELTEIADVHAIETFARNVQNLLMQPPLKHKVVMGIDPAFRTGCKVAVVDVNGRYLEGTTIYPVEPHNQISDSEVEITRLIEKHKVNLIAIGNGTASRETEQFIANYIKIRRLTNPVQPLQYLITNEAGASVYSASTVAREEFPELDAAQRGNISIARRVLDPLSELVKIDPRSIGVGLYQHDVNQIQLSRKLEDVVESCVNTVGVHLNTASVSLLTFVSGLNNNIAENIVGYRNQIGGFKSRDELRKVTGLGAQKFEQAAGFLRISESDNPLDNTAIHPESYKVAKELCNKFSISLEEIRTSQKIIFEKIGNINKTKTASELGIGVPTLDLIIENLLKSGRDPRESLPQPILREDILRMEDLTEGQELEGTVRNVVDFGAFIDVGLKQDGLLHISKMSADNRKIENPHEILSVGDIIKVSIESIDQDRGRIGLKIVK